MDWFLCVWHLLSLVSKTSLNVTCSPSHRVSGAGPAPQCERPCSSATSAAAHDSFYRGNTAYWAAAGSTDHTHTDQTLIHALHSNSNQSKNTCIFSCCNLVLQEHIKCNFIYPLGEMKKCKSGYKSGYKSGPHKTWLHWPVTYGL